MQESIEILGYFTIALKVLELDDDVSKTKRKKLDGLNKEIPFTPVYLIGQLGKNNIYKSEISGKEIIDFAIYEIMKSFNVIGGRIVLVECSNNQNLTKFYQDNDFELLQETTDKNNNKLLQFIRFLF